MNKKEDLETNQDRWNKVRSVEKELEELERDIENVSFRQLAELKRMCRRGYKIFSNQQEKEEERGRLTGKRKRGRKKID